MVLVGLLSELRDLLSIKTTANIDNAIFKLHYKITSAILFAFCLLVTTRGLLGDPINCIHGDKPRLNENIVNTYCWIHTTFTLPKYFHSKIDDNNPVIFPGVGPVEEDDSRIYHAYYQWVPFVLFLQGLMFYVPHWLWKVWEGGKIEAMIMGLSNPIMNLEEKKERVKNLADYLSVTLHLHNGYAFKFLSCEVLNAINSICNLWFLDKFLGGRFLEFGVDVVDYLQLEDEERTDPLIILFPRVTKCTFRIYGPSGTPEKHDLMCVLALNIINEKIFIFLWFWFIVLAVLSGIALVYRCSILCFPSIRVGLLSKRARTSHKDLARTMTRRLRLGDHFVLHLLSKNVDFLAFKCLLEEFYLRINSKQLNIDLELGETLIEAKS